MARHYLYIGCLSGTLIAIFIGFCRALLNFDNQGDKVEVEFFDSHGNWIVSPQKWQQNSHNIHEQKEFMAVLFNYPLDNFS